MFIWSSLRQRGEIFALEKFDKKSKTILYLAAVLAHLSSEAKGKDVTC